LDLKLPGFDGYQILDFICKKKIESKIIVMTAKMKIFFKDLVNEKNKKEDEDLLKIANFILLKPFKINDLINIIKEI
jgi:CheY-like chemotaxis protein